MISAKEARIKTAKAFNKNKKDFVDILMAKLEEKIKEKIHQGRYGYMWYYDNTFDLSISFDYMPELEEEISKKLKELGYTITIIDCPHNEGILIEW